MAVLTDFAVITLHLRAQVACDANHLESCELSLGLRNFVPLSAASVLSRLTFDNPPRPLGGEGGERSEPGEGVGRAMTVRNYTGHDTSTVSGACHFCRTREEQGPRQLWDQQIDQAQLFGQDGAVPSGLRLRLRQPSTSFHRSRCQPASPRNQEEGRSLP